MRVLLDAAIQHGCKVLLTGDRTQFGARYRQTIHGAAVHSPCPIAERALT
jgi:hypothetical protein